MSDAAFVIGCRACEREGRGENDVTVYQSQMMAFNALGYHRHVMGQDFAEDTDHGDDELYVVEAEGVPADIVTQNVAQMTEVALFLDAVHNADKRRAFFDAIRAGWMTITRDSGMWFMDHYVGSAESLHEFLTSRVREGLSVGHPDLDSIHPTIRPYVDVEQMITDGVFASVYETLHTNDLCHIFTMTRSNASLTITY